MRCPLFPPFSILLPHSNLSTPNHVTPTWTVKDPAIDLCLSCACPKYRRLFFNRAFMKKVICMQKYTCRNRRSAIDHTNPPHHQPSQNHSPPNGGRCMRFRKEPILLRLSVRISKRYRGSGTRRPQSRPSRRGRCS